MKTTAKERAKYQEYLESMKAAKIEPRPVTEWVEHYRKVQSQHKEKVHA